MIRVVLLDDEELIRSGISMILNSGGSVDVVATDSDGDSAVELVSRHQPDVLVTDIRMPKVDGLEVTRRVRHLPNPPEVILLTTFDLDEYVYAALDAGAAGFLLKDTPPGDLVRGVEVVARGDAILAPGVTRRLIGQFATGSGPRHVDARRQLGRLTDRELEVAVAIATGASNFEIAQQLFMSEATVKVHVSRILTKLDADNRTRVAIMVHQGRPDLLHS